MRIVAAIAVFLVLLSSGQGVSSGQAREGASHPKLVGYFPQWGLYETPAYTVNRLSRSGAAARLDQINYAQGFVTGGRCSVADPHADTEFSFQAMESVDGVADEPDQPLKGNFHQLIELKRLYPRLKVLISLEGSAPDFAADATAAQRVVFVTSCVQLFLAGHLAPGVEAGTLFDGIDVDWEYPGTDHAEDFLALLAEFRRQMDALRPGLLLSIAVGPAPRMAGGDDLKQLGSLVDEIGLMTYDLSGPWSKRTGFHAALLGRNGQTQGTGMGTGAGSIAAFEAAGVPPGKILLGVPFYGYSWSGVGAEANGLDQEGQGVRGDHPYAEIEGLGTPATMFRDPGSQSPWIYDKGAFWTYDDPVSIRFKGAYVREHGLGGVMAWELGEDTAGAALVHAAWDGLRGLSPATARAGVLGSR